MAACIPSVTLATSAYMDAALLPQFAAYYRRLGVADILVLVNKYSPPDAADLARANDCIPLQTEDYCPAYGAEPTLAESRALQAHCKDPRAPVIFADLDEFYEFPGPLSELAARIKRGSLDAVRGRFLDRVTVDGSIPLTPPSADIWREFPIGCELTAAIIQVNTEKVMLTHASAKISGGHHGIKGRPRYAPRWGIAHHFKWRGSVVEKARVMQARYADEGKPQAEKIARLLAWLGDPPRIDVKDPRLDSRHV